MTTTKVVELVEDLTLYPRMSVSDIYVSELTDALQAGATIPAITADDQSKRIVDGVHRCRATSRAFGPDAEIEVIWKSYADDASLLADAIQLNADHGRRMCRADLVRCVHLGQRLGFDVETVASLVNMTCSRLESLVTRRTAYTKSGSPVVLGAGLQHLAGRRLTKGQIKASRRSFGNVRFYAELLANLIEAKALDLDDERLLTQLRRLNQLLNEMNL